MIDGKSVRKKLIGSNDERAVSPVIGVVLMVAITVILAAVIAAFVLDMGSPGNQSLSSSGEIDNETSGVTVELTAGGGDVDGIAFVNSNGNVDVYDEGVSSTGASNTYDHNNAPSDGDGTLSDGSDYTVYAYQGTLSTGDTIDDADANVNIGSFTYQS